MASKRSPYDLSNVRTPKIGKPSPYDLGAVRKWVEQQKKRGT